MSARLKNLGLPLLIIALGLGGLLTVNNVLPGVNWIWVLALAATGVLTIVAGVDKVTVVVGPFLIASAFFSLLRQTGRLSVDAEAPWLVISFGVCLLAGRLLPVPAPKWIVDPPKS